MYWRAQSQDPTEDVELLRSPDGGPRLCQQPPWGSIFCSFAILLSGSGNSAKDSWFQVSIQPGPAWARFMSVCGTPSSGCVLRINSRSRGGRRRWSRFQTKVFLLFLSQRLSQGRVAEISGKRMRLKVVASKFNGFAADSWKEYLLLIATILKDSCLWR